ncbi:hypothetical protein FSP39_008038 [Pinctada imbricata]|uniref:E3 ubiquitin-protein ligase RNF170 n=1 Tax=Pinctada imbricata TaxID=66713 RepID=A0AA88XT36_PINIB|nr:hypothetical protein FSP39_008038 [Pinctada imbricata]
MTYFPRRSSIIEGVGDEVVYAFGAFLGIFIPLTIFVVTNRNSRITQNQRIHPESAENVRSTREEVQRTHPNRRQASMQNTGEITCPICLGNAEYGIETNCGHTFCGTCITTYWQHGTWLGAVRCPVCRQQVTLLLINFTEAENDVDSPDRQHIIERINDYNRRFSGEPRPLIDYLRDLPTLLRHAFTEFFTVGGLIWMFRLRIIVCFFAAFMYFISPLDIIPEAVFGVLGFMDDLFILLLLAIYISIIYRQYVQNRPTNAPQN